MLIETIGSTGLELEVLPELGASVLNLRSTSGRSIFRKVGISAVSRSSDCASFSLIPYSNRIRQARFLFAGQEIGLQPTKGAHAQHGDVRNRPWQVIRTTDSHLICTFDSRHFADMNWSWPFTARVEYRLVGGQFDTTVILTNVGTEPMPAGIGLHPYFARLDAGTDPLLSFDALLTYDNDAEQLPTAEARPITPAEDFRSPRAVGDQSLDRVYTAWDGIARLDWGTRSLTLTADNVYSHLVVYTAPDGSLALEPVSHATDAFNLAAQGVGGVDMRVLLPGQTLAGTVRLTLEGQW